MASPPDNKPKLIYRIAGNLLARYIHFVHRTSWQTREMTEAMEEQYRNHPALIGMWHGQFMLLPLIKPSFIPVDIMVARHSDAEFLGVALRQFDMRLIRGAGAAGRAKDRGGVHAYRAAVQAMRDGRTVAMTADIPGGKAREAGMGIVMIARQAQRPIMPVAIATTRYLALPTWSRMTINLPFSGLGFAVGPLVHVPVDATPEQLEACRKAVEDSLNFATRKAYERAGADPSRATPGRANVEPGPRLKIYRALTAALSPFAGLLIKTRERRGKEDPTRRNERLGRPLRPRPPGKLVWFHAASVGETLAILPLIDALSEARPELQFLLTTGTVTSAKIAGERLKRNAIHQFAPLDVPHFVRGFLDHWKPDLAVFTESEIWPNLILESSARGIPLTLVNARMTERSYRRWRRNKGVARPLFSRFALVLAQNEMLARRFASLGAPKAVAAGNLKVDSPPPPIDLDEYARLKHMLGNRPVLIAASTHEGEESIVADAHLLLARTVPGIATVIAPRHPERGPAIAQALREKGLQVSLRSRGEPADAACQIYIADTIGELGLFYKIATIAFIGGSLVEHGGQNPIEAVRQGVMVLTGPSHSNFADAYRVLLQHKAAIEVDSAEEIAEEAGRLLADEAAMADIRNRATQALATVAGALPKSRDALLDMLSPAPETPRAP